MRSSADLGKMRRARCKGRSKTKAILFVPAKRGLWAGRTCINKFVLIAIWAYRGTGGRTDGWVNCRERGWPTRPLKFLLKSVQN